MGKSEIWENVAWWEPLYTSAGRVAQPLAQTLAQQITQPFGK